MQDFYSWLKEADGKEVEYFNSYKKDWTNFNHKDWKLSTLENLLKTGQLRIKQKPKKFYVAYYSNGTVAASNSSIEPLEQLIKRYKEHYGITLYLEEYIQVV